MCWDDRILLDDAIEGKDALGDLEACIGIPAELRCYQSRLAGRMEWYVTS